MRYKIKFYSEAYLEKLKELMAQEKEFTVPSIKYLRDVVLCVIDTKTNNMVAFVCAVTGLSNTAYVSHLILDKKIRRTKNGYYVLKLIINNLEKALKWLGKDGYEGFVNIENKVAKTLYDKRGGKCIGKGYLYRKEINND
ncbi:MAG: hypothetical protein ABIB11_02975 [Candidatus Omnitrophota bacterium]